MKIIGCIPARFQSTRLPGKPLVDIAGKPMIIHVLERAKQSQCLDDLVVLTDDERIQQCVTEFGFKAVITSEHCQCGTERVIEYAKTVDADSIFVNIQGDEVLLDHHHIDALVTGLLNDPNADMATTAHVVHDKSVLADPSTAKIVTDLNGYALYFSRQCIPVTQSGELPFEALVQIGLYAYRPNALKVFTSKPVSPLEQIEKLEQLRGLQHGLKIRIVPVLATQSLSVDTPADLQKARLEMQKAQN